jgi:osmotically-inducible protein OsmY
MQATAELDSPATPRNLVISSLDDVLMVAAEARLMNSPYLELHRLSCECHAGTLTLHGCVSRYYLKQIAQNLVGRLSGLARIDNQLTVLALSGGRP